MASVIPHQSDNDRPQPRLVIPTHGSGIWRLAYLPDGRHVVTGSDHGSVKVWNLEEGEQEGTSMEHENGMCDVAVTRDGTKIVSGDEDGKIKLWDVKSHELIKEWAHPDSFPRIAISPDDRLIAVGDRAVAIYSMEGVQAYSINVGCKVSSLCFSPDGKKLACATDRYTRVYDVGTGTLVLGPLEGPDRHSDTYSSWVWGVLWSHDGSRIFSASVNGTIRCWSSDTGEQIGHPWTGHTSSTLSLSLSPDGSILASASFDKTVRFWDATTGNPIRQHLQHDEPVNTVHFSPSGESMASLGWGGRIYLWRVPWLNPVENQARTLIRCTSVSILIALSTQQASLDDFDAPHNRVDCAKMSLFHRHRHRPSPTHIRSAEQDPNFDPGVSIYRP